MNSMGFVISHKNNEKRRALLPADMHDIRHTGRLYFEKGYGEVLGIEDKEYRRTGAHVVSREEALRSDLIVDVKLGDADYLDDLTGQKTFIGWAHAAQKTDFTDAMLEGGHTVIAWEDMFEDGRYIFYRNREVAGEAAVLQAYQHVGKMPYETTVAVIGRGQTAKGALRILHGLGATVDVYGSKLEKLFRKNMADYDVIVNCVLWDTSRTDRLIYREDLKRLKPGTMIIDVSCDPALEIETSRPTTIDDPVYEVDGILHYCVDNTPAMFPHTITHVLSKGYAPYIDRLIEDDWNDTIESAVVIRNGSILHEEVWNFREQRGLLVQ